MTTEKRAGGLDRREEDRATQQAIRDFLHDLDDQLPTLAGIHTTVDRVWGIVIALAVALGICLLGLGIVAAYTLHIGHQAGKTAEQANDTSDRVAKLSAANTVLIAKLTQVADTAQTRGARTDRQQCLDIEHLKAGNRLTLRRFIQDPETRKLALQPYAPRTVRVGTTILRGAAACNALPNSTPATPQQP